MNFFQRAIRYITRKKTKTILLMITFFLIGNLVILGLGISGAADNAKILTRKQMRAAVAYETDWEAFYKYVDTLTDEDEINDAYKHYPKISAVSANKIAEDSRIKAYNYLATSTVTAIDFDNVPVGNESQRTSTYVDENGNESEYREPNIMIHANRSLESIELSEGTHTIVSGRYYNQNDIDDAAAVCLITSELAEQNGLSVGDSIKLQAIDYYSCNLMKNEGFDPDEVAWELEIIGIYSSLNKTNPNAENFQWMSAYEAPENMVLVPYTSYVEHQKILTTFNYEFYQATSDLSSDTLDNWMESVDSPSSVVFLLNDPLEVEGFVKDYEGNLEEYTRLNANNDTFKKLARPLDTLSFFANIIVWIVVVNAVVIISLITALTLKTREFEIGVLLSIGVSKFKVVLQLFAELILIALLGFTLAVVSGSMLAGTVGDVVLEYQTNTESQYESNDNYYTYWSSNTDYFTTVTQDQILSQYHVEVSPLLIGEIYLLGTMVVLVAIMVPTIMIMRLNPKQILLEQN